MLVEVKRILCLSFNNLKLHQKNRPKINLTGNYERGMKFNSTDTSEQYKNKPDTFFFYKNINMARQQKYIQIRKLYYIFNLVNAMIGFCALPESNRERRRKGNRN